MKNNFLLLILLLFSMQCSFAQVETTEQKDTLVINYLIYSFDTTHLQKLKTRLESEIYGYSIETLDRSKYVAGTFDNWRFPNSEVWFLTHWFPGYGKKDDLQPLLTTFQKLEKDIYKAQVVFYYGSANSQLQIGNIYNFYLKYDSEDFEDFYFISALDYNTREWKEKNMGNMLFKYPSTHKFNKKRAMEMVKFNAFCSDLFDVPVFPIEYFIFSSTSELYTK